MTRTLAEAPKFDPLEFFLSDGTGPEIPCTAGFDAMRKRIAELREQSPVLTSELGAMVIGRDAVHTALGDKRLRSGIPEITAMQGLGTDDELVAGLSTSVLASEGDRHIRLRRLATRALTPRAVAAVRPAILAIVDDLVASLDREHCEFMASFADRLPVQVICEVLGIPPEDRGDFASWNKAMTWALSAELAQHRDEIEWGIGNLSDYVSALIERRRDDPGDDLVSSLIQAQRDDPNLEEGDVAHMVTAMLFAGHDTTRNQLGLGMWFFAHHQDQWQHLRDDVGLVDRAVEEILRFRGAAGSVPRIATEDVELAGYLIPAGTFVTLGLNHANADPAVYECPLEFDVTLAREAINSFGGGRHYCLGANLARAELQDAFRAMAKTFASFELAGEATWRPPIGIFGPETLPLRFVDAPAAASPHA